MQYVKFQHGLLKARRNKNVQRAAVLCMILLTITSIYWSAHIMEEREKEQQRQQQVLVSFQNDNWNASDKTDYFDDELRPQNATKTTTIIKKSNNDPIRTSPTKVKDSDGNYCKLTSQASHSRTLARVVLFQRDGRHQLRDFVSHYTKVLSYNSLVIMDHEGVDEYTKSLLNVYGEKGAHIWQCYGEFKGKANLWSQVTKLYGPDSGFIFPVDVDELMAVQVGDALQWSYQALKNALAPLSRSGKPFKMNWLESVPAECHPHMRYKPDFKEDVSSAPMLCDIQYVKSKEMDCMDKAFSWGGHFLKTDTGNHYGGTLRFPEISHHFACRESREVTWSIYDQSTIVLVHLKEKTFEDWLVHGLRGATDRGFTDIKDIENTDCETVKEPHHYCHKWQKIARTNFSPYELRKVYTKDICPESRQELLPVHDTFCDRKR